jgi:apolipoprotein N-acyltransferase
MRKPVVVSYAMVGCAIAFFAWPAAAKGTAGHAVSGQERSVQVSRQRPMSPSGCKLHRTIALGASLAVSAALMALAIETPRHFWLGWITLLPLMQAARVLSPGAALGAGAFWGGSLVAASAALGADGVQFNASSIAILLLGPALYSWFGASLTRRVGFSPYLMALGWVGVELCLRPVGLEQGLLAGTQGDGLFLRVAGSFAGYFLIAFFVAYINASLLSVIHKVTGVCGDLRLAPSTVGAWSRLVALAQPFVASRVLCISQPRAPPAR